MKKTIILFAIIVLGVSCEHSDNKSHQNKESVESITEEEALALLHQWTNAYLEGNAETLEVVLDDSWVYSGSSDGTTSDKRATIEEFSNADYRFAEITYEDLEVNLYNDIAVVRGWETMIITGDSNADTTMLKLRFTDVYQKKEGKVKAIATHSSPINDEEGA